MRVGLNFLFIVPLIIGINILLIINALDFYILINDSGL